MRRFLLFAAFVAFANTGIAKTEPETFCGFLPCTTQMRAITEDYGRGDQYDFSKGPFVASGACYHIHPSLKPEQEHHGLSVFTPAEDGLKYQGLFSFFAKEDPYKNMSHQEASVEAASRGSPKKPISAIDRGYYLEFPSERALLRYWFRVLPETNELLEVSEWSFAGYSSQYIFCRLKIH